MTTLNIVGRNPINVTRFNNLINLELNESGVRPAGNSDDIYTFSNNINEISVDKYGLVHSVITGSKDYLNAELFKLYGDIGSVNINGHSNINILGKDKQINTVLTDDNKNVLIQLTNTNVNMPNTYIYDLRINIDKTEYFDTLLQQWRSHITLIKGKLYIFKQSDANFVPELGPWHAINLREAINTNDITTGIEFFINNKGPFTNVEYNNLFKLRSYNSNPYFKFFISDTLLNAELYSVISPRLITPLTISCNRSFELNRYFNINSIAIDNTGRIHDVDTIYNYQNMVSFNILDGFNNSNVIKNDQNFQIKGKPGHVTTTYTNNNTIEIKLT